MKEHIAIIGGKRRSEHIQKYNKETGSDIQTTVFITIDEAIGNATFLKGEFDLVVLTGYVAVKAERRTSEVLYRFYEYCKESNQSIIGHTRDRKYALVLEKIGISSYCAEDDDSYQFDILIYWLVEKIRNSSDFAKWTQFHLPGLESVILEKRKAELLKHQRQQSILLISAVIIVILMGLWLFKVKN